MKIYEFQAFPNPRRVRIFLAEKNKLSDVTFEQINVLSGEHRGTEFKKKNLFSEVPTLELDNGVCISESVAICKYFEEQFPSPSLMGIGAEQKAKIEMWQRRSESALLNSVASYFHHATEGLGELEVYQNHEWGIKNKERAINTLYILNENLKDSKYIVDDSFSIADITTLCGIDFAKYVGINIPDDCQNLKRWYELISSRPSVNA
jgi:glutathione S-transferase